MFHGPLGLTYLRAGALWSFHGAPACFCASGERRMPACAFPKHPPVFLDLPFHKVYTKKRKGI